MKQVILAIGALATLVTVAGSASAAGTPCAPEAKKFEWHMCIGADVPYKRGMKTETRDECAVDKVIAKGTCELGDLASYIPEGTDLGRVSFYAVIADGLNLDDYEIQYTYDGDNGCTIDPTSFHPERTMKFSDAFDKSNSERAELVVAKLKKKKLAFYPDSFFLQRFGGQECKGMKAAAGMLDKKTQSKFVFLMTATFPM